MAKFINSVAQAGKDAYPLPMCLNVWMGGPGTNAFARPGDGYPSGGGQAHTLDLWKATAPAIDVIAPDIYDRSAVNYRQDSFGLRPPRQPAADGGDRGGKGVRTVLLHGHWRVLGDRVCAVRSGDQGIRKRPPTASSAPSSRTWRRITVCCGTRFR